MSSIETVVLVITGSLGLMYIIYMCGLITISFFKGVLSALKRWGK